jgi:hypothetical protein
MAAPVLQFKRGNAGVAGTVPALRPGEPGFSLNNFDLFVGFDTSVVGNKFFGSHRYWTREDGTNSLNFKLVDKDGSNYVALKTPDTLAGNVTYVLPGTQGANQSVLTNDGSGNLSWASGSLNAVFTGITTVNGTYFDVNVDADFAGITTFSNTTDNTLGDADTGAVQIDGGLGVNKNVTVGGNLNVQGYSEFVGVATFKGGTINLGDSDTDDINVAGEFISNLVPNTDDTYDIGDNATPKRWRHAAFSGVGTFATGAVIDAVQIGISGASEIDTSSGDLTLDSATGQTTIDDNLVVTGITTLSGDVTLGDAGSDIITIVGIATFTTSNVYIDNNLYVGGLEVTGGASIGVDVTTRHLLSTGITTVTNFVLAGTSGIGITGISASATLAEDSDDYLPTQKAVKAYVDAVDVTLGLDADSGGPSTVSTSQTLTISGTTSEVETSVSGQTITIGLPNDVIVGTSLSAPTVKVATIQHSNGTQAATIDTSGNITASQNLTVTGDLFVNGSTTQVNTSSLTVEDRTIELGVVDGNAPASATTWDLGVVFNYNSSGAKKSGVIWEHADARFKFGSEVTAGDGTDNDTPQVTFTAYAPIEIASLWVNDCAGQSQVISCTGTERFLENITIDAGTF